MDNTDPLYQFHFPRSLSELSVLMEENQDCTIYWGQIERQDSLLRLHFPCKTVISLKYIDDFSRITRSERYIEAGSSATIQDLLEKANKILPIPFINMIEQHYPLPLRNQISLGALTSKPDEGMALLFHLLDILVDIRRKKSKRKRSSLKSYWYYYNQYFSEDKQEKDLLASIRIPLIRWEQHLLQSIRFSEGILQMMVLTDISRGYISDFRMGFQYKNLPIIRNRDWEANVMGRKHFFNEKEKETIYDYLIDQGVPHDATYLKPALMMNLDNLLYHFQDSSY